jgi:hypothetical protein
LIEKGMREKENSWEGIKGNKKLRVFWDAD